MKKRYTNVFDKKRRDLLKILTTAGISKGLLRASPLVMGMMYSRLAEAQNPNKSLIIYVPDGCIPSQWTPNSNLTSWGPMSQPYNSIRTQCNFLRSMGHHRGGHGVSDTLINNSWGDDSFEVNMGRILGENLPFGYINLGVHSNGTNGITKEAGTAVPYEDNPFNAFNRLFGNLSGGGGGSDPTLNVVDAHLDAINALKSKLGSYEQQRLDLHLTAIEETQQRLIDLGGGTISCDNASTPSQFPIEFSTFQQQAQLQANNIALAFSCNLLASASLSFGNDAAEFRMPYLNYQDVYHQSIHGGSGGLPNYPYYQEMRAHLSSLVVYTINALSNRGVLNSTIVCEVNDMGHGDAHGSTDVPLVMFGGGGAIQRGVSNSGGASYTPLHQIHTAAVAMNAHQHPLYQGYQSSVIPGVLT